MSPDDTKRSPVLGRVKGILSLVPAYVALQRALGADRLRYRCLDTVDLHDGDVVIDVGCGPAYYFDRLPKVRYFGFDTDERYIEHARKKYGDRGEFRCEVFSESHLADLPPADAVLLLGLLHHLSDEDSRHLLQVAAKAMAPTGQLVTVDVCFEPTQGRISRWMSDNDRGKHVREPAAFEALARESFGDVEGEVVTGITRVPSSFYLMRMRSPRTAPAQPAQA